MRTRVGVAIAGAGAVAAHVGGALFFASHDPYTTQVFAPCPILTATGWQCPGCGATRAAYSLFHGDLVKSFTMNPLLLSLYAVALLIVAMSVADRVGSTRLSKVLTAAAVTIGATAAVYSGIVRNLV